MNMWKRVEVKEQVSALASSFATLIVNGKQETFQLDSGSKVNIMTDKAVMKLCG